MAYTALIPAKQHPMKINNVIKHFGSQAAAASALGVTQPTISNWKTRGKIPKLQQLRIEHITSGKLRAVSGILPKVSQS
jgi:DNA-binding transcriptional regulator YdaS (Cro superfamily)